MQFNYRDLTMATQPRNSDKPAEQLADTAGAPASAIVDTPARPPRLGDTIQVKAAPERIVRGGARGRFTDDAESITVTLRILRLLQDGDLIRV